MANVKFVLDADEAKAAKAYLRLIDKQTQAENKFGAVNRKIQKVVDAKETAANRTIKTVGKIAGAWVSVQGAISLATTLLDKHNAANDRAATSVANSAISFDSLTQVATGPADLQKLKTGAKSSSLETGMTLDDAAKLQFALRSTGHEKDRKIIASLNASIAGGSLDFIQAYDTMDVAMKGGDKIGSPHAVHNKALAIAGQTKFSSAQIMSGMPRVAAFGKGVGATDEEVFALVGLLSASAGRVGDGATQAGALLDTVNLKGHGGKGAMEGIKAVLAETEGMSAQGYKEYFGLKQGRIGAVTVKDNMERFAEMIKQADEANYTGEDSLSNQMVSLRRSDPESLAYEERMKAQRFREIEERNSRGIGELGGLKLIDKEVGLAEQRGDHWTSIGGREWAMELMKTLGRSDETIKAVGDRAAIETDLPGIIDQMNPWEQAKEAAAAFQMFIDSVKEALGGTKSPNTKVE